MGDKGAKSAGEKRERRGGGDERISRIRRDDDGESLLLDFFLERGDVEFVRILLEAKLMTTKVNLASEKEGKSSWEVGKKSSSPQQ